jgi:flavin reductase (DIM6/NTAB) family NADH-FMN oxidoreductase RutF
LESKTYRNIMRGHAGAVAVIATGTPGQRTGLTATAVCSLSDSPPTVLICVNHNASAYAVIRASGCFSVNWLAAHQDALADCFAGKTGLKAEQRFAAGDWITLETGAPVLGDGLASLDCELVGEHDHATHSIFIGRVRAARQQECARPLMYFAGAFTGLALLQPQAA